MTDQQPGWCYRLTSAERAGGENSATEIVEFFEASSRTSSAWGPHMQHGGPVTGLLVRALERAGESEGRRISRVTTEIFGMVPVGPVRVTGRVVRPGRRVELLEATMEAPAGGRDEAWKLVATARAWRYRVADTADVARPADAARDLPPTEEARLSEHPLSFAWWEGGFVDALRWKIDAAQQTGSQTLAWGRLDVSLVRDEPTTPLQALVSFADTANGVGARLDPTTHTFLNTEMTVHLFAPPEGEWFGIEAESSVGPDGAGMSAGVLHAPGRPIGRVTQALLVEPR